MKLKADNPQVRFRPSVKLQKQFQRKCKALCFTQDCVLIELTNKWVKGEIRIPPETRELNIRI